MSISDWSDDRRHFLANGLLILGGLTIAPRSLWAKVQSTLPSQSPWPDPRAFQAGDLLWPKRSSDYVPYGTAGGVDAAMAREQWLHDRDRYVQSMVSRSDVTPAQRMSVQRIAHMSYEEFLQSYAGGRPSDKPSEYGTGGHFYVGHVAMITERSEDPLVVEALWGNVKKVRTIRYADWLQERKDDLVWHGRLKQFSEVQRQSMAMEALTHVNRPYDFWNFDLNDDKGFYCSKLVWMSAYRAFQVAVDDNSNPRRAIWFSPKQLMHEKSIEILHSPGNYGTSS